MTRSTGRSPYHSDRTLVPPTVTLALWRVRCTWGLLVVTGLGIIAAVLLVCAVPLYSDISMTAGLRGILTASPQNAEIVVHSTSGLIDSSIIDATSQQLNDQFQRTLGPYLGPSQFSIETPLYPITTNKPGQGAPNTSHQQMQLISYPMDQAAHHASVLLGRLPRANSDDIEIAITQESADSLKVTIGSTITVKFAFTPVLIKRVERILTLHVIGIFKPAAVDDPFWHGHDFLSTQQGVGIGLTQNLYTGLVSNQPLVSALTQIANDPALNGLTLELTPNLFWYYHLDASHITINDLEGIVQGIRNTQVDVSNIDLNQDPYIENTQTFLPSDILGQYRDRIPIVRLPVLSLLALVLFLVLFFVSMMTDLLVDRQSDAIAILRSRGASRQQIFGSIVTQSIGLGLIALVAGPLLALPVVYLMLQQTLSPADQSVLSLITANPLRLALGLAQFALVTVVVTIIAMAFAVFRATRLDVLAMRREVARSTRRPLWLRLNLDVIAIIIMLVGYAFSSYLTTSNVLDVHSRLLLESPLTLVGSTCLLLACLLLFLRFLTLLLGWGAWLAARSRGAAPLLALAQMARAPRQALRMTLLLSLATAFAIFTLVLTASQVQRILDVTDYQGGADFRGTIVVSSGGSTYSVSQLAQDTAAYRHIPGVTSATLGYSGSASAGGSALRIPIELRAVDANTFALTAIWTSQDSSQSLASLMAPLAARQTSAISEAVVPAVVDASTWQALHLSPNAPFTLRFTGRLVNFIAIAKVDHIPTVTGSAVATGGNGLIPAGGVLVDYTTYANAFKNGSGATIPINSVWLRTRDDPASLASVRHALSQGLLQLDQLYDRRALFAALHREPLYLDLIGVLALGATTALLLALVGNLLASWLNARSRLTNFAVLRALGTAPRELASVLTWEQSLIYSTAIVLGVIFGSILSVLTVPALVFTSVAPSGVTSNTSSEAFYTGQSVPPIQLVIPPSLGIALIVLVVICGIALGMMIRIVSQPSISQTLRLNED